MKTALQKKQGFIFWMVGWSVRMAHARNGSVSLDYNSKICESLLIEAGWGEPAIWSVIPCESCSKQFCEEKAFAHGESGTTLLV